MVSAAGPEPCRRDAISIEERLRQQQIGTAAELGGFEADQGQSAALGCWNITAKDQRSLGKAGLGRER